MARTAEPAISVLAEAGELHDLRQQVRDLRRQLKQCDERDVIHDLTARAADAVLRDQGRKLEHHKRVFHASAAVVRSVTLNLGRQMVVSCLFAWKHCYVRFLGSRAGQSNEKQRQYVVTTVDAISMPSAFAVQPLRAILTLWLQPPWKGSFDAVWWERLPTVGYLSWVWWVVFALWHVWLLELVKAKSALQKPRSGNIDDSKALFVSNVSADSLHDENLQKTRVPFKKEEDLLGALAAFSVRLSHQHAVSTFCLTCLLTWASAAKHQRHLEMMAKEGHILDMFHWRRKIMSSWFRWSRLVRCTQSTASRIASLSFARGIKRALLVHYMNAWILVMRVRLDLRVLSRRHLFVLKKQDRNHKGMFLRCLFSVWNLFICVVAADKVQMAPTPQYHPRHLRECVEDLVSIRSRRCRLFCDLRTNVENSLLKVGEMRDTMLLLIQRGALLAMPPEERLREPRASELDAVAFQLDQELEHLVGEAGLADSQFKALGKLRTRLGRDLLNAIGSALRRLLESSTGTTLLDGQTKLLLVRELGEFRMDEHRLSDSCGDLIERLKSAASDVRSVSGLRLELDVAACFQETERTTKDSKKLNIAVDLASRLLDHALENIYNLQSDARSLFEYLDSSQLLEMLSHAGEKIPELHA